MTLAEKIRRAAAGRDPLRQLQEVEEAADFMRFAMGLSHAKSLRVVEKSGVSVEPWEDLLSRVDNRWR